MDAKGIPDLYDVGINGVGYLIAWEAGDQAYRKVGQDILIDRYDQAVEEMTENKLDGLYWASQRSWFNGGLQSRLNAPFSDAEKYLMGKNIDTFSERGGLTLSRRFESYLANVVATTTQVKSYSVSDYLYLYWTAPKAADATTIQLRSVQSYDTASPAVRDTGFGATAPVEGMTSDGNYVYASSSSGGSAGIRRGALSSPTTTLSSWSTKALKDIAFLKERIMGWKDTGSGIEIWDLTVEGTPTEHLTHSYGIGWRVQTAGTGQQVFTSIKGFIAWVMTNGTNGYLWLWNGTDPPFQAAKFEGIEAWGIFSYAESNLYIMGRFTGAGSDPHSYDGTGAELYDSALTYDQAITGAPVDRTVIIEINVSGSGDTTWDILHIINATPYPRFLPNDREIVFVARLPSSEYPGITTDAGVAGTSAYTIASFNVVSKGLNLGRYWGLTSGSTISAPLWGDAGFTAPTLGILRGRLSVIGEYGGIRRESGLNYAPTGELVSSRIDFNIDSDKVFLVGECGFDELVNGTVELQYSHDNLFEEGFVTWTSIGSTATGELIRKRLTESGVPGVRTAFAYYKVILATGTTEKTPIVRKAGLGAEAFIRPRYDHQMVLRAYDRLQLNNSVPHPQAGPGLADTIQQTLEVLRANQSVVDFQEPTGSHAPRTAVKAQLREIQVQKKFDPKTGFENLIQIMLRELPAEE